MLGDRSKLYDDADEFFELEGSFAMKLTRSAAIEVMLRAADHGQLVTGFEAGIWHNPGFEARLDGICDTQSPNATSPEEVEANNKRLAGLLDEYEPPEYDTAIVNTCPIGTVWE